MSKQRENIDPDLAEWIKQQRIFFVASAPLSAAGHINLSPKGGDSFRVLGPMEVAYQEYTGSMSGAPSGSFVGLILQHFAAAYWFLPYWLVLVVWLTLINFLYLLTQMAIAVEDLGVREGMVRVAQFIRGSTREVAGIFGIVLLLVTLATIASILATAGLSLIAFIPLVGLAIVPLQAAAWLVRGFVFEYLALTALGAYLTQYRHYLDSLAAVRAHEAASEISGQRLA